MERRVTALILACLLTACGAQATKQHSASSSPSIVTAATAASTATPSPTATVAMTPVATPPPPAPPRPTTASTPRPTPTPTPRPTAPPPTITGSVSAINFAFSPSSLSVRIGTRVTFANRDAATHTFTANGGLFNSGNVAAGQSYSFTFMGAGTFAYHCQIHSSMTGTITVTG